MNLSWNFAFFQFYCGKNFFCQFSPACRKQSGKFFCNWIYSWRSSIGARSDVRFFPNVARRWRSHTIRFVDSIGRKFYYAAPRQKSLFFFYEFAAALRIYAPCAHKRGEKRQPRYILRTGVRWKNKKKELWELKKVQIDRALRSSREIRKFAKLWDWARIRGKKNFQCKIKSRKIWKLWGSLRSMKT